MLRADPRDLRLELPKVKGLESSPPHLKLSKQYQGFLVVRKRPHPQSQFPEDLKLWHARAFIDASMQLQNPLAVGLWLETMSRQEVVWKAGLPSSLAARCPRNGHLQ
ncbi:hypothetical protein GOP47_0013920 [Adiantum capillus-veneris]|uniref:Uncharacterized protein n=1 Tax=Adiantum capillus-veneris TaxID=13818 RepID=A0A9D4UPY1_ADICA|nr:hypothetical protein GOP47_0013920 [Adiantum capillus-veneris]